MDQLSQHRDVHGTLMDIMMPEMFDAAELLAELSMGISPGGTHAN